MLDGVVNNAGIIVQGPVEGTSLDDLSRQLDVNVTAQIGVVQAALPQIRQAGGRVVFMSSVSGLITLPGTGAYSASKYALESLADALRMELRPWRIPVSLIEPGPTRTDMWGDALDDYDRMTSKLSAAHRELYGSHLAGNRKLLARMQKLTGDPKKVVAAVDRRQRCSVRCRHDVQVSLSGVATARCAADGTVIVNRRRTSPVTTTPGRDEPACAEGSAAPCGHPRCRRSSGRRTGSG